MMFVTEIVFLNQKDINQYMNFKKMWSRGQPLSGFINFIMIGWDPWIKKRDNYLSCIEGKVTWKTFGIYHNSTRQLFSIIKYLLFKCWYEGLQFSMIIVEFIRILSAKKLFVHPKCKIILVHFSNILIAIIDSIAYQIALTTLH